MGLSTPGEHTTFMIQPIRVQGRVPLLAVLVLALATLVSISFARITTGAAVSSGAAPPSVMANQAVLVERPAVPAAADKSGCGTGAYVSGDLVGDASPTEIYAALCGGR
jgi:hypothetical protein